jgi:hypothetical protein
MENLKVNDWVMYEGNKRQIAIVNGDGTVRLKSDDPNEKYYDNGTIGCFSASMFVDKQKTAVEWLINEITLKKLGDNKLFLNPMVLGNIVEQALEMEKQQFINLHIECMKEGLIVEGSQRWEEKYLPKIKEIAEKTWNKTYKSK